MDQNWALMSSDKNKKMIYQTIINQVQVLFIIKTMEAKIYRFKIILI